MTKLAYFDFQLVTARPRGDASYDGIDRCSFGLTLGLAIAAWMPAVITFSELFGG